MRNWSLKLFLAGPLFLFVAVALVSANAKHGKNARCAMHCLSGCNTRGPGRCDTKCKPSYKLQRWSGKCISRCGVGCYKCNHDPFPTLLRHCVECLPGFRLVINRRNGEMRCTKKRSSSNPTTSRPPVCDPNCVGGCSDKSTGHCDTTCKPNYMLTSDFYCAACDPNCEPATPGNCVAPGTCTVCKVGFSTEATTKQCVECAPGCISGCTAGVGLCDSACSSMYRFSAPLQTCEPCDPNCVGGCASGGIGSCDGPCAADFGPTVPFPAQCAACDPHCTSASGCGTAGAGFCESACDGGWTFVSADDTCQQCQPPPECSATTMCTVPGTCLSSADCGPSAPVYDTSLSICKV